MKNKLAKSGLLLLSVINVTALLTFAYHRWVQPKADRAATFPVSPVCLEESLSLNGAQKKCLKDIRLSFGREAETVQARMREKRKALVDEIKSDTPDLAAVGKLIEEISGLQAEIQKMAVSHLFEEKQLLTPEQKEIFFRLFENHVCPEGKKGRPDAAGGGDFNCPREDGTDSKKSHRGG
ncbi:MAG: Spy/CpxP family protein refolding chaperone [Candidatus Aminicenantes bacterium]|jgi:hypothetical protein|nr:Spy/CpxP family protein refolding chaperone [Candidatus Aminicenantes bacterium]